MSKDIYRRVRRAKRKLQEVHRQTAGGGRTWKQAQRREAKEAVQEAKRRVGGGKR